MFRNSIALCVIVLIFSAALPAHHKPATKVILMKGMKFIPSTMTVSIGDTVIWKNESDGQHNVVANDGSFKSSMLEKGETYSLVFEKKGQLKYYCQPHRIMGMKGKIEVE